MEFYFYYMRKTAAGSAIGASKTSARWENRTPGVEGIRKSFGGPDTQFLIFWKVCQSPGFKKYMQTNEK